MQVMEVGDEAAGDDLLFHHHRRASAEDRDLDECTKRALTEQDWPDMNAHAEARTGVMTTSRNAHDVRTFGL